MATKTKAKPAARKPAAHKTTVPDKSAAAKAKVSKKKIEPASKPARAVATAPKKAPAHHVDQARAHEVERVTGIALLEHRRTRRQPDLTHRLLERLQLVIRESFEQAELLTGLDQPAATHRATARVL